MKFKIKSVKQDYKQLFKNFVSLSSLQGIYYILPLITLPYLVRVLGTEQFGIWVYASNLISYFQTFTEYGFHLSATKEISVHRKDQDKISEIFCSVLQIKVFFLIFYFFVLLIILLIFDKLNTNRDIFLLTYGMVIGQALFPLWYFQGIERMSYITNLNLVTRILATISIFIFIKSSGDLVFVPIIYSASMILLGILAILIAVFRLKVKIRLQPFSSMIYHLKEGWHIFLSSFSVNIYIKSNIIILGIFANNLIVGQYAIAEKLIFALRGGALVLFQTIYPYVCRLATIDVNILRRFLKKLFIPIGASFLILSIFIYILADKIIYLVAGEYVIEAILAIKILALFPLLEIIIVPFYQTLLALNKKNVYSIIMALGAAVNILLNTVLAFSFSYIGTSIAVIITDLFIVLILFYKSKNLLYKTV